jgi:hypothetical protein
MVKITVKIVKITVTVAEIIKKPLHLEIAKQEKPLPISKTRPINNNIM